MVESSSDRPCVCGEPVTRAPWTDYFKCPRKHTTWRGVQEKPTRYELRPTDSDKWNCEEEHGTHDVWDLLEDQSYHDGAGDWYAFGISEARARSLLARLNSEV